MAKGKKKTLVLLDSHAILHRAFHALPNFTSPDGQPTGALYGFTAMILKIISELEPDYLAATYDLPEPTFRHNFYEKYKAHRPKTSDELSPQIDVSKKILEAFGIPFFESKGFEADDILATIAELLKSKKDIKTTIVTGDLDTLQLVRPGVEVYTMRKGMKDTVTYNEKAVRQRYGFGSKLLPDFKGLMGDPSDNIIGVKGIGEKTAKILIENFGTLEKLYKSLKKDKKSFEKAGIKPRIINLLLENEEEAFFSKTLAEARKDVPLDFSLSSALWSKNFDKEKLEKLFNQFGFRSLLNRLPLNGDAETGSPAEDTILQDDQPELEQEIKIAFWLLDSRRTKPTTEEILSFVGTNSLSEVKKSLLKQLEEEGLLKLFTDTEEPLIPILKKMEEHGVLLDINYLKNLSKDYHKKLVVLEKKIWKIAGTKFNINSPKQLGEVLFEKIKIKSTGVRRTSTGVLSTRFSELLKIENRHPVIKEIFKYRELQKLTSTYIDALPPLVDSKNRLHTSFNQAGTTTGRISSLKPNLQNLPVRKGFGQAVRCAFVAPKGYSLISFDYSQIELRVAAFLSGDKKLKTAFRKGEDIHARVASEVFNVDIDKVDKEMRRRAKVINFGIIYGMGINSLAKNLDCSREEARLFYDEYFNDFSGMSDYLSKVVDEAAQKGYTETLLKRRRYIPEIVSPIEHIRKEAERMAVNAPIQGTATGDIIKMAMVKIGRFLADKKQESGINMILQIHDELLFEVRNDIIKETVKNIRNIMEFENLMDIPLIVDVSAGSNWGKMKTI